MYIINKKTILMENLKDLNVQKLILKEILFLSFVILLISIGSYFFLSLLIEGFLFSFFNLGYTISLTFSISVFLISVIIFFKHSNFKKENIKTLISDTNEILKFISLNKTDKDVVINKSNFLYVEAIKNNVHIYYYDEEIVKTISIRNTLKNIENQFQDNSLFRCHRSFIVNTNNIKTAKGNSNRYKIYFDNYNHFIPVSRSYTKDFQNLIY